MTGCGGKDTTCSRRSSNGSKRSTNGISRVSPGFRVRWYLPSRSTTPARACGMIRTDRTSTIITNTISTSSTIATAIFIHHLFPSCFVLVSRRQRRTGWAAVPAGQRPLLDGGFRLRGHDRGGPFDGADHSLLSGRQHSRFGPRTPDVPANLDEPAVFAHGLHDDGGFADEAFNVGALIRRAPVEMFECHRPDKPDHEQGNPAEAKVRRPGTAPGEAGN